MKVSDLFNFELKKLQKKYGGSIKDDTWSMTDRKLGLSKVEVSVYRGVGDFYPTVSVSWDTLVLVMKGELHVGPHTHPSKVRWFLKYLDLFDPELREAAPHIFEEYETSRTENTT